jgi:hypothetical protein
LHPGQQFEAGADIQLVEEAAQAVVLPRLVEMLVQPAIERRRAPDHVEVGF